MTPAVPWPLLLSSWRFYRSHPWQALLVLVSVSLGSAVVVAVGLANQSAMQAFDQAVSDLSPAATHRLVARRGALADSTLTQLMVEWGIDRARPELHYEGGILRHENDSAAIDVHAAMPLIDPLPGDQTSRQALSMDVLADWLAGEPVLALSRSIAVELGIAVGDTVQLEAEAVLHDFRVVALVDTSGLARAALADLSIVQSVSMREGELDGIALSVSPSQASTLEARLPAHLELRTLDQAKAQFAGMTRAFRISVRAMSLLTVLIGAFLVYNTLVFLVLRRRATLGAARLIGATRGQLFRLLLCEAAALGLVGAVLGMLVGVGLAHGLLAVLERVFVDIYGGDEPHALVLQPVQFGIALLTTLSAVLLAALGPAREAAMTDPVQLISASSSARVSRFAFALTAVCGVLAAIAGACILYLGEAIVSAYAGLFLIVVAYGAVLPVIMWFVLSVSQPLIRRSSILARLVFGTLQQSLSRTSLAVSALAIALAAAIGIGNMVGAFRASVDSWLAQTLSSDVYLTPRNADTAVPLTAEDRDRLASLAGVASVSAGRRERGKVRDFSTEVMQILPGAHSEAGFPVRSEDDGTVWLRFVAGEGVLVSEPLARRLTLAVGDRAAVSWAHGQIDADVLGVFRDYSSSQGVVVLSSELARVAGDTREFTGAGVALSGDVSTPEAHRAVRDFAHGLASDYELTDSAAVRTQSLAVFDRTFAITSVIKVLVTLVAVLGVFGALTAVLVERRRDFSIMRAVGLTIRQRLVLLFGLAGVLGLLASVFAMPLGALLAWLLTDVINTRAFGWSIDPLLSLNEFLAVLVWGPVAAVAAALIPAAQRESGVLDSGTRL